MDYIAKRIENIRMSMMTVCMIAGVCVIASFLVGGLTAAIEHRNAGVWTFCTCMFLVTLVSWALYIFLPTESEIETRKTENARIRRLEADVRHTEMAFDEQEKENIQLRRKLDEAVAANESLRRKNERLAAAFETLEALLPNGMKFDLDRLTAKVVGAV